LLSSYDIKDEDMKGIIDKKRDNLHKAACMRLFEAVHPGGLTDNVGNHPNAFFNSSIEYRKRIPIEKKNKNNSENPIETGTLKQN
jgi:hypothetical protein